MGRSNDEEETDLVHFRKETTEEALGNLLADYRVESIVLKPGKYAVLTFEDQWAAEEAMRYLGGGKLVLWGYWLRLKFADR